ncbi:MAG: hypothetical protein WKF43_08265, partial [Acidimicrobiales bacterium]
IFDVVLIQRFVIFLGFPTYALSVVLFAMLLFTGVGSALSARTTDARRGLTAALTAAVLLMVAAALGLQPLLEALIGLPFPLRVAVTVLILAPFGCVMGMAMPIGLRRLAALHPSSVAFAWGVNGVASVLGSVLAVALALSTGFRVATIAAALCYLVALLHAVHGSWAPAPAEVGDEVVLAFEHEPVSLPDDEPERTAPAPR